jgi:CubicO group peptidase (beta-lactamase class C family)
MRFNHDMVSLFLIGILGICMANLLSSAEKESNSDIRTHKWKTITGKWQDADQAERFLHRLLNQSKTTALSVALVKQDRVIFQSEMGIVDKKSGKFVDGKTVFRAASMSKPVFAYLVMTFIDEGLIDLDESLNEYLERPIPDYSEYQDLKSNDLYKLLTARIILSHQSGFPNWRFMNKGKQLDFKFTPGDLFKYSGEGYGLLQLVLEQMTGKGLQQLAYEKVFQPLGMQNSSFIWERRFDSNFAVNLDTGIQRLIERTKRIPKAAASLLTNTRDYAKFLLAIMNGKGLKSQTLKWMLEPQIDITSKSLHAPQGSDPEIHERLHLAWSLGLGRFQCPEGDAIFHVGYEEGCDNYAVIFLDHNIGIVIQSVINTMEGIAPRITKELIGDVYSPFSWLNY